MEFPLSLFQPSLNNFLPPLFRVQRNFIIGLTLIKFEFPLERGSRKVIDVKLIQKNFQGKKSWH